MGKQARNYTVQTLKKLFALSGNECSFPGCTEKMVNQENAKNSNICHIEGANDDGERHNEKMTDKQRADYQNLILLCIQHHDETNYVEKYSVEDLQKMKRTHESRVMSMKLGGNPSMLKNAINAIAGIDIEDFKETEGSKVVNPEKKIAYNSVKRNALLINDYKIFYKKIDSLYDELELQGSIKKEKLLFNIKSLYTKIKGRYTLGSNDELGIIQENSDNIIDEVYDELFAEMENSNLWQEDIVFGIRIIMVDAFIRCKILEEPKDDN